MSDQLYSAPPPANQAGVTLIEVLVALVVFSIGLLGLAALQVNALQANHSSYLRAQATSLAYDITDRMRANSEAAESGNYITSFQDPQDCTSPSASGPMHERDLAQWHMALNCSLPQGRGQIEPSGNQLVITIEWEDPRFSEPESFETSTQIWAAP